jgi:tyrosine-protein phosphatase YwqE
LLAHPERNPTFQDDPSRVARLVEQGALLQVTARSITTGARSSRSARLANELLRRELVHVLASDSHGPGRGRPMSLAAARAAADRMSPGLGWWLVHEAPTAVLRGEPVPPRPVAAPRRARWWARRS